MRVTSKVQNIKINFKLLIHIETKVKALCRQRHSDSGYIIPLMPTCLSGQYDMAPILTTSIIII